MSMKEKPRDSRLKVLLRANPKVAFERSLPFFEKALLLAREERGIIVPVKRIDKALESDEWRGIVEGLPCLTGLMTAYEEPGKKLGEQVEYTDPETGYKWIFTVPKDYREERDAILVAEHTDYELKEKGDERLIEVPEDRIGIVLRFPYSDAYCYADPIYGIPTLTAGDKLSYDRFVFRTRDKKVGPLIRERTRILNDLFDLVLFTNPNYTPGVIIEVADNK